MNFQLLHDLKESSLLRTEAYYSRHSMRDILDYTFLYLLVFEIMRHDEDQKDFVRKYVTDTLRYGIDFKRYKKSGTDFYNFLHILFDESSHENLKDPGRHYKVAKDMSPQKSEFLYYLNAIRYGRDIPESTYDRWMLKLERQLLVKNGSYKAIRRMARTWHTVDQADRHRILSRLGRTFRQELRLSDLTSQVNKITVDTLTEDTQSGLNWAVGKDIQQAKGFTMNNIMSGDNVVVWVDIAKAMGQVEKGWELDLKDPTGGVNKIGNRVEIAKEFFKQGNYMDPSFIGVSDYGKIVFQDGRHRLVAAYQLGARTAPVIVSKENLAALKSLGVVTSSGIQEAEHNLMVEDMAKEYVAEYKYADIGIKSLGIPRNKMPQIKKGMQHQFLEFLHSEGIMYEYKSKPAELLKATQDEFDPKKVQKKSKKQAKGKGNRPLVVSMDNYIIDGHHRWTSSIQRNPKDHVKILQVYMPIRQLLELMYEFEGVEFEELDEAGVGKIVKGVNTTIDVGPGETQKQAKKFGFRLNKKNEPPLINENVSDIIY